MAVRSDIPTPGPIPFLEKGVQSSRHGAVETNPTRNHEVADLIPGLSQWVKDLALLWLWLWCRLAAVGLI